MESYRQKFDLDGASVVALFENQQVFEFLEEGYEVLHTQGKANILIQIEKYIQKKVTIQPVKSIEYQLLMTN